MYSIIMQIVIHCTAGLMCESSGGIRILLCVCCSPDTTPRCSAEKGQWICHKRLLQRYSQSNKDSESEVSIANGFITFKLNVFGFQTAW